MPTYKINLLPNRTMFVRYLIYVSISTIAFWGLFSISIEARATVDSLENVEMIPEVLLRDNRDYCEIVMKLNDYREINRKNYLMSFMERSLEYTSRWKEQYSVAGIDYVNFRYLSIITYSGCDRAGSIISDISKFFSRCEAKSSDNCLSDKVIFSINRKSQLVRSITPESELASPVLIFQKYRGMGLEYLQKCVVEVPIYPPKDGNDMAKFISDLYKPRIDYHMPIMDEQVLEGSLYILFSRQCESKITLYNRFLELLDAGHVDTAKRLGTPDFNPDVARYRASEIGESLRK